LLCSQPFSPHLISTERKGEGVDFDVCSPFDNGSRSENSLRIVTLTSPKQRYVAGSSSYRIGASEGLPQVTER
jgi:hypothetical protein